MTTLPRVPASWETCAQPLSESGSYDDSKKFSQTQLETLSSAATTAPSQGGKSGESMADADSAMGDEAHAVVEAENSLDKALNEAGLATTGAAGEMGSATSAAATTPSQVVSLTEGQARAVANYKKMTGIDATPEEISKTPEGIGHWCCLDMKVSGGSAIHSAFNRALKHDPVAKEIYENLPDEVKCGFKKCWEVERNFEFTKVVKTYTNDYSRSTSESGEFLTVWAIANLLGGWSIPACRQGAINYCVQCYRVSPATFVNEKNWTGLRMFRFVRKLSLTTSMESWRLEVKNHSEVNEWEALAQLQKAQQAYVAVHGGKARDITKEFLNKTPLGVKGWADAVTTKPNKNKNTGNDAGTTKGGKPRPAGRAANPTADREKSLKDVLCKTKACQLKLNRMREQAQSSPDDWLFAKEYLAKAQTAISTLDAQLAELPQEVKIFAEDFEVGMTMPKKMGELRKTESFLSHAGALAAVYTHALDGMSKLADRIQRMKDADNAPSASGTATPAKKRAKHS